MSSFLLGQPLNTGAEINLDQEVRVFRESNPSEQPYAQQALFNQATQVYVTLPALNADGQTSAQSTLLHENAEKVYVVINEGAGGEFVINKASGQMSQVHPGKENLPSTESIVEQGSETYGKVFQTISEALRLSEQALGNSAVIDASGALIAGSYTEKDIEKLDKFETIKKSEANLAETMSASNSLSRSVVEDLGREL